MSKGTVKWFNSDKGYGFIQPEDGSKDLFVHHSEVNGSITDNDTVEYESGQGKKGPCAVNVSKI